MPFTLTLTLSRRWRGNQAGINPATTEIVLPACLRRGGSCARPFVFVIASPDTIGALHLEVRRNPFLRDRSVKTWRLAPPLHESAGFLAATAPRLSGTGPELPCRFVHSEGGLLPPQRAWPCHQQGRLCASPRPSPDICHRVASHTLEVWDRSPVL